MANHHSVSPIEKRRIENEAVKKAVVLMMACLMDEFDYTQEQLEDFGKRFIRYNTATEKGLLTVRKVTEIVNEMTGFNMIKGFTSKDVT